jgi:hypothetical protein
MMSSTKFKTRIIFNGTKKSFNTTQSISKYIRKYKPIYFPDHKIYSIACNFILTNSMDLIDDVKFGGVIDLPTLSSNVLDVLPSYFKDDEYVSGQLLHKRILALKEKCDSNEASINLSTINQRNKHESYPKNSKIKVLFLSQMPILWQSANSVWLEMKEDDSFDASIVQLPFHHKNYTEANDGGRFLEGKSIPFKQHYNYDIDFENPDVIIFLSPYDSTKPKRYRVDELVKRFPKIVYIPYALGVAGSYIIKYNFQLPIHYHAWKVFLRSSSFKDLFENNRLKERDNLVVVGHPKMDAIFDLANHSVSTHLVKRIKNRTVFLWNPHHTLKEEEWSTFTEYCMPLINKIRERKNIFLIVRPHPFLFKNLRYTSDGKKILKDFLSVAKNMSNVYIDSSGSYLDAFKLSHAMISDSSSLLMEYFPTKKPILYTPKIGGGGLNASGSALVEKLYQGTSENDIFGFIDMIEKGDDPMYDERTSSIDNFIYKVDGKAGYRIREHIKSSFYK